MSDLNLLIVLVVIIVLCFIVGIYLLRRDIINNSERKAEDTAKQMEIQFRSMLPEVLNELVKMSDDKLKGEKEKIHVDMENKRAEIHRLVKEIQNDLKRNQDELVKSDKERINSFSALKDRIEEQQKLTEQLRVTTDSLRKVLSDNQLRGQFGEQVADDLLKMAGFVKGVDYDFNKKQSGSETRPDFSVYLPDGTKINVDAKFPYSNLQKMSETENKEQKQAFMKQFERDVKEKVKQVTSRDYINSDDNTVDFVILFIPNEMIFSFIYENLHEVWQGAMGQKVILAGPFSFTAILRMVRQAYQNFNFQQNIKDVITNVNAFSEEFGKFSDAFDKVGVKIQQLEKEYNSVSTTRVNQLRRSMSKVRLDQEIDSPSEKRGLLD